MSISLRLTLWFSLVCLLGLGVFGAAMWGDLALSLSQGRDKTVGTRARRAVELLQSTAGETESRRIARFQDFAEATPEGRLIQVFDGNGHLLYPAQAETSFPWPSDEPSREARLSDRIWSGRHYRVLTRLVTVKGVPYRVYAAGQLEDNRAILRRFTAGLLWAVPALVALSALCGYFLSRRALTPVDRLIHSARSISITNLSRRLPVSRTGDELERLASTCNEMLDRVEGAVLRITRFTADASHELRSPLTVIRTVAELALRDPGTDAESAAAFEEIVAETANASLLLEDMLTLARGDSGHAEAVFEPVDLHQIVSEACEKIRPLTEVREHLLSLDEEHTGPLCITGDAPSLRRLFWILLDNAMKYTPQRGAIEVSLRRSGAEARVFVRDSGIGIPAAALPHIFERFYRVDSSRGYTDGTGLGLAIAKWIADIHQATLSVESEENHGTTFQVVFRLAA